MRAREKAAGARGSANTRARDEPQVSKKQLIDKLSTKEADSRPQSCLVAKRLIDPRGEAGGGEQEASERG